MRRKFSLLGVICATAAKLIHNRVARFTGWAVNKQLWAIVNQPRSFFSYFRRECGSLAVMIYGKFVMNATLVRNADGEHFWMESLLSLERSRREIRRREMFTRSGFSINRNDELCRISIDNSYLLLAATFAPFDQSCPDHAELIWAIFTSDLFCASRFNRSQINATTEGEEFHAMWLCKL